MQSKVQATEGFRQTTRPNSVLPRVLGSHSLNPSQVSSLTSPISSPHLRWGRYPSPTHSHATDRLPKSYFHHHHRRGASHEINNRSEEHTSELQSLRHLVCR